MKIKILTPIGRSTLLTWLMAGAASLASAQNISWGPATGITGDANLVQDVYYDAFLPNPGASSLTVDGLTFNAGSLVSSTSTSDGIITATVTSGTLNDYSGTTFPTAAPSSAAFAAVMNAGGIYQNGGAGAGTVTITGLTAGQNYEVQVFNYASDGDAGLTTLSGTTSVTLGNLPGAAGPNTYGEFATGTFTASSVTETFNWTGAGSGYTVLGAIYVVNVPAGLPPTLSSDTTPNSVTTYINTTTTFSAAFTGTPPLTNEWAVSTDGGNTFQLIPGATNNTLTVTNNLAVNNVEYYLTSVNAFGSNNSSPASLTVLSTPPQTIIWGPATGIIGDKSLVTNGVYVDAFLPNPQLTSSLTVDGIAFNPAPDSSGSGGDDGVIFVSIVSGNNNSYSFSTFPSTLPSSPAFAAVMNAGGTY